MTQEHRAKLDSNGRVVVPARISDALGIRPGDDVVLRLDERELRITAQRARIQHAQHRAERYVKGDRSAVDELLEERRREAVRIEVIR